MSKQNLQAAVGPENNLLTKLSYEYCCLYFVKLVFFFIYDMADLLKCFIWNFLFPDEYSFQMVCPPWELR